MIVTCSQSDVLHNELWHAWEQTSVQAPKEKGEVHVLVLGLHVPGGSSIRIKQS